MKTHNCSGNGGKVRLMFQDEAGFGRINRPKYCWCEKGIRSSVLCRHIWEYRYAYGAYHALLQYGVHKFVFAGIVQTIS